MPDLHQRGTASPTNLLLTRLKAKLQDRFSAHLFDLIDTRTRGTDVTLVDRARLKSRLERVAAKTLKHTWRKELTAEQRERLVTEWLEETWGLGPLEPLLKDPSVSEIM